jgi:hypothetical protein
VVTEQVNEEIKRKDDQLAAWCDEREELFRPIDDVLQDCLSALMARHERIAAVGAGRNFADPFVIALAQSFDPRLTVVTEEDRGKAGNPKIPYICREEGLTCINFNTLLRNTGWREKP